MREATLRKHTTKLIGEILQQAVFRYLTVRPHGLEIDGKNIPELRARILYHGPARTLYSKRRPKCRSIDGLAALSNPDKTCADCSDRSRCTPQIRLDLLHEGDPFRLLLAFTSAKNFLLFEAKQRRLDKPLDSIITRIRVVHRGAWGELRFENCER